MRTSIRFLAFFFIITCRFGFLSAAEDILIADFEGETYGPGWKTEGTAFGTGPVKGKFPGQMDVTGYLGERLVNSFNGGDVSKGKLTSPPFKIERPYLSFLIGGGGHAGLSFDLIVGGETVRTATGPNIVPGGSETLHWCDWDVAELKGKEAVLEIVDNASGGWGHINIDHIVQTDRKKAPVEKKIDLTPEKKFLHIPITMNAPNTWVRVEIDGLWQQEFDCPLTVSGEPDFYACLEIGQWKGKKLTLIAEKVSTESRGLAMLRQDDSMPHEDTVYGERYRPRFHYTTRIGWINDPNGLLHYKGTWHLFSQHNPYSTKWGNMTWGHATSPDLVHWTEQPDAIHPDKLGTIFSGSGVVDWNNTSGFQKGDEKPLVLIFTYNGPSARFGHEASQGIAYSTDGGKTFTKYEGNPVLPHIVGGNRDPKVIWHEASKRWIMALYMDKEDYTLFGSKDLKKWEKLCDINKLGCSECPDFFPLPVDGDPSNVKWLFWGGNGKYLIGSFDGKEFKRETEPLTNKYGGNDYAAMTFSDSPDGRRIQLSWMATWGEASPFTGMPFNHQYTVPRQMTLRTTPKGVRLFMEPVKEIEMLRYEMNTVQKLNVSDREEGLIPFDGDLFDAELVFDLSNTKKATLDVAGQSIGYDVEKNEISLEGIKAPLELSKGKLKLRILVDRTSIELFAGDGEVQIAKCFLPKLNVAYKGITVKADGGGVIVENAKLWKMKSIWKGLE